LRGTYRLDDQQVKDRTDITIKMANVANESAEIVSDQLTAVLNNFYNGTQTLEHYADAMVALGAATASSSDEIAGGLERFSSIADMIGLSFDYAASALATITATTRQSEDVVGTALRTIFARIQGLKLGETLDDDTDLNKYSTALQAVGISIFNTNGELKDMDNILDELGDKWKTLSKAQQVALAQTVAGVRQYNQLVSLMDNWDYFKENLAVAQNSDGELNRQAEIYAESWEAARNRVRAAAEELYSSLINDEAFIKITNGIGKIIEAISSLTQGLGGLSTIIPGLILGFNKLFGDKVIASISNVRDVLWYNSSKGQQSRTDLQNQIVETSNVLTQNSQTNTDKIALEYRKQQLELESKIASKSSQMNDDQVLALQIQKEQLKTMQDRTIELAEQRDLLQQQVIEIEKQLAVFNSKKGEAIDYLSIYQNDALFNVPDLDTGGYGYDYLITDGKIDWKKSDFYKYVDSSSFLPQTIDEDAQVQLAKIFAQSSDYNKQITDTKNALTELQEKLRKTGKSAKDAHEEIDQIFQSNNLNREDFYQGYDFRKLKKGLNAIPIAQIANETDALKNSLVDLFNVDEETLQNHMETREQLLNAEKKLQTQEEANAKANKQLRDNIIITSDNFTMYGKQILTCANNLAQFGIAISALTNLKEIWNNDSLTDIEKFSQTLISVGMIIGNLIPLLNSLKSSVFIKFFSELIFNLKFLNKFNFKNLINSVKNASFVFGNFGKAVLKIALPLGAIIALFSTAILVLNKLGLTQKGAQEKIEKANAKYQEQKEKLDELNTTLEETKTKIDELNNKDNLTIIEQQELNKLKNSVELLEQQKKIQEEITKQQLKSTAEVGIKYNRNALKDLRIELQGATENSKEGFLKDLHLNSYEELLATGRKSDIEYYEKLSSASMKVAEVIQKNQEIVDNFNNSYDNYIEALSQGLIEIDQDFINEKSQLDLMTFGGDKNTYGSKVINPLLNTDEISKNSDHLFSSIASGITDTNQLINLVGNNTQKVLAQSGISAQAYVEYIQSIVSTVQNNIQNLPQEVQDSINQLSKTWTTEDWQIAATLSPTFWEEVDSVQDVLTEISNRKYSIQLQVDGAEKLSELYDKLTKQNDILKSALEEYGENGFLSIETAKKLVDSGYADYLVKTADGWVLNAQALEDYQTQQDLMNKSVEEMVNEAQSRNTVNLSYLSMPENFLNNPAIDNSNEKISELRDRLIEVQENAQKLQASGFENVFENSNLENYLKSLDKVNENINNLSENKNAQEATIQFLTEQYTDTIVQLNHAYETGAIDMDTYRAAMGKIEVQTNNLLVRAGKFQKYITATQNDVWKLKENDTELSEAEQEQLKQMIKIHNTAKDVNEAFDALSETLDDVTDYWENKDDETITVTGELDLSKIDPKNYEKDLRDQAKKINYAMSEAFKKNAITEETYRTFLWKNFHFNPADINNVTTQTLDGLVDSVSTNELGTTVSNMMSDSHDIITDNMDDIYKAVSDTMGSLADLIQDFKYTINFSFEFASKGPSLKKIIESFLTDGDYSGLSDPDFGNLTISGDETQAAALANKVRSFGESIAAVGTSRKGLQAYTSKGTNNTVLDPNTINDLLGKDKGSGSGSNDTPDYKDKKEFDDKYRDINNELERTTQLLDAIEKKEDKAFGRDKLKYYTEQIDQLNNKYSNYNELAYQANVYRQRGIESLKSVGINLKVQDNGVADDELEYWQHKILDDYNAVVTKYNSLKSKSAQEAMQDEMDAAEKLYNKRKAYLDEFDSDTKQFYEAQQNKIDTLAEIWEVKLKQVKNEVDTLLDVQEFNKVTREIGKKIIESYNDVITQMSDANQTFFKNTAGMTLDELNGANYKEVTNIIKNIRIEYSQLQNMLAEKQQWDGVKNTKELAEAIKEAQNNLNSSLDIILEYEDYMENKLSNAVDAARERFNAFINQLDHNDTVLNSIKDLMTLQGETYKTQKGFSDLQNVASSRMNTALTNAKLQQQVNEKAKQALEEAQKNLDVLKKSDGTYNETDPAYDMLKKNRDALLEEYNQTQKDLLTAAKNAMDAAEEMYTNAIERASYKFEQAITSGMGFDLLQEKYDNLIDKEERYFDKVNERYNAETYYNKVQKAIDETTDTVAADRLKRLQTELDVRKRNNQLNQYDLDILEAKYNLTIAQNALEEAQNAKDSVRLVRNSAGNWDYQFTANQDDIDAAQDDYNKALNDWYNIAKDQTKNIMDEILKLKQDTHDQLEEIYKDDTLNEQEKNAKIEELRKASLDKLEYLQREYNIAMDDMNEAGKLTITDYSNTYQGNIDLIDESTKNFEEAFKTACDEMEKAFGDYNSTLKDLAEDTGTDLSNLRTMLDEVADSTKKVGDAGQIMSNQVWDSISSILAQSDAFKELLVEIQRIKAEIGKDAQDMNDTYNNQSGARKDLGGFDLADMGVYAVARGYTDFARDIASARAYKLNDGTTADEILSKWLAEKASGQLKQSNLSEGKFSELYVQLKDLMGFSTGGYTENGGVAILHDKELVLNQDDTANMLSAIKILDSLAPNLAKILDNRANVGASMMATKATISSSVSTLTNKDTVPVVQQVQIQADFPGVTSALEIEMALNNIINDATQYTE
jgi:TP901 family phage tail tape measure protein